jgi:hypothetical protein
MNPVPRYTVIVPMRGFDRAEPVLASLRENGPPGGAQVLVATGSHPARQRNAALNQARGGIIVFLDNDCTIGPAYWSELDAAFAQEQVEVIGGPALLTHPLVVGPIAARYAPRGIFRPSSQTELILCNLAARHAIFARTGPLSTELYPNEENEWLDRAQAAGVRIFYDPLLQVFRPQRDGAWEIAVTLLRYGIGRTRQWQISGWRPTLHQAAPVVLLAPLAAIVFGRPGWLVFAAGWLLLALFVAATCERRLGLARRLGAGLAAPMVPLLYALGQVVGLFGLFLPVPGRDDAIALWDEAGRPVEAKPGASAFTA